MPSEDLDHCQQKSHALDLASQDRVKWIMQTQQLREWLESSTSRTILINGNMPGNEVISPTTRLCAQLLRSLQDVSLIIPLHFFCSLHTLPRHGIDDTATGLIKSFITQLLMQDLPWDLSFLKSAAIDRLGNGDLEITIDFFYRLIQQVPKTTFCFFVIDGITYYERSDKCQDFVRVVNSLLNIIDRSTNVIVKMLLTCHGRSAFVKDYIDEDDRLTVPHKVQGDSQGWSQFAWEQTVGRQLEDLDAVE